MKLLYQILGFEDFVAVLTLAIYSLQEQLYDLQIKMLSGEKKKKKDDHRYFYIL